jgi:hypothetical protein
MKSHAALGLVLVALLLGFVHLAMYLPAGIGAPGLIGLAGLAFAVFIYFGVTCAQRFRQHWFDRRPRIENSKIPCNSNPLSRSTS